MTGSPRNSIRLRTARARRVFDRSIALARCRWECLRRTAEYRADIGNITRSMATSTKWPETKVERSCFENGGILEPCFGTGPASPEHYDKIRASYGLTVLVHPDVAISEDAMAAFPIFTDTPGYQPVVRDRALLRRVVRRGGDVSPRTQRRIFTKRPVDAGPFRLRSKRLHVHRFDTMLAVFDARIAGQSFPRIAADFDQSRDQVKRAWRTARALIPKWVDLEAHIAGCLQCQAACLKGDRDRYCDAVELQIGDRRTSGSRLHPMSDQGLDLLAARQKGQMPARRSARNPDSSSGKRPNGA